MFKIKWRLHFVEESFKVHSAARTLESVLHLKNGMNDLSIATGGDPNISCIKLIGQGRYGTVFVSITSLLTDSLILQMLQNNTQVLQQVSLKFTLALCSQVGPRRH